MLGGEQGHQLQVRVRRDEIDVGRTGTVDTRMIRDESDTLSANALRHGREENLDTGSNGLGRTKGLLCRVDGADGDKNHA